MWLVLFHASGLVIDKDKDRKLEKPTEDFVRSGLVLPQRQPLARPEKVQLLNQIKK